MTTIVVSWGQRGAKTRTSRLPGLVSNARGRKTRRPAGVRQGTVCVCVWGQREPRLAPRGGVTTTTQHNATDPTYNHAALALAHVEPL